MIVTEVVINHFASFGNHMNKLVVDNGITTIVGMNGAGKSNLVELIGAIDLFKGTLSISSLATRRNKSTLAPIEIYIKLVPSPSDDHTILGTEPTTIILKETNGTVSYTITGGIPDTLNNMLSDNHIRAAFGKAKLDSTARQTVNQYLDRLTACEQTPLFQYRSGLNALIKDYIKYLPDFEICDQAKTELSVLQTHINHVIDVLPLFFFQRAGKQLKTRYSIQELRPKGNNNSESLDTKPDDLLLSLLQVAGIDRTQLVQALETPSSSSRESIERRFNNQIESQIMSKFRAFYKKDMEEVRLEFRLEHNSLNVHVTTGYCIMDFLERSNGLRWYLNMYIDLLTKEQQARPIIFVLDEPGIYLHVNAQNELKNMFGEQAQNGVQIIYTTHSPYMIPACFTSLRGITKSPEEEYSQIHNAFNSTSFQLNHALDTLTPIAAALGMDMRYSFAPMRDKFTIITEGITDQVYLTVMAEKLGFAMNNVCVIPSTGADNVKHLCSILLGWGFSFTALFDFDKAGRSGAHSIITHLGLEIGQGIELLKCISHDEFIKLEKIEDEDKLVIESIFSPEDRVAFGINPDDVMAQKKIAAKRFQHSIRIEQKDVSNETKSAFRELLSRLLKQAPQ